uniref:Putative secreted protein n=1 Tax=Ixodes ricinus TaxID=34613 RepID=A0A6B0TWB2_IXORI
MDADVWRSKAFRVLTSPLALVFSTPSVSTRMTCGQLSLAMQAKPWTHVRLHVLSAHQSCARALCTTSRRKLTTRIARWKI